MASCTPPRAPCLKPQRARTEVEEIQLPPAALDLSDLTSFPISSIEFSGKSPFLSQLSPCLAAALHALSASSAVAECQEAFLRSDAPPTAPRLRPAAPSMQVPPELWLPEAVELTEEELGGSMSQSESDWDWEVEEVSLAARSCLWLDSMSPCNEQAFDRSPFWAAGKHHIPSDCSTCASEFDSSPWPVKSMRSVSFGDRLSPATISSE
eukprot:TRINITY_DN18425_c0_g1_i1.p1 TRINITY_DN18425_c0_g1~~TRINITY_DN18425_c0_g1_i1.p1  ORF type:complete len:209 (+),score=45.61 TRINITY_DN18425_c0_g1_i1:139-765(+)